MTFLTYLINGISLGSVYAIIALGYTMVYGIAKMLNFAHGDVIMVGAYICFCTSTYLGLPAILAVIAAVAVCTLLGIVIEGLAYKPLRSAPSLAVLITAIGVSYFLQNIVLLIFGSNPKSFQSIVPLPDLKLAGGALIITGETIVTIISCIVIMIALTSSVILSVITMIFGSLHFSSILISICIGSPPRYGYSIGKSRSDFYRFSIGGCFKNIGGIFYGNLILVCMGGR